MGIVNGCRLWIQKNVHTYETGGVMDGMYGQDYTRYEVKISFGVRSDEDTPWLTTLTCDLKCIDIVLSEAPEMA